MEKVLNDMLCEEKLEIPVEEYELEELSLEEAFLLLDKKIPRDMLWV